MMYLGLYLFFGLPIAMATALVNNDKPFIRKVLLALVYLPLWPLFVVGMLREIWTLKRITEVCAWCGTVIVEHNNKARLEKWKAHHRTCPNHPLRNDIDELREAARSATFVWLHSNDVAYDLREPMENLSTALASTAPEVTK